MADLMILVMSFISCLKDEKKVIQAVVKLEKEFACYKNILKKAIYFSFFVWETIYGKRNQKFWNLNKIFLHNLKINMKS